MRKFELCIPLKKNMTVEEGKFIRSKLNEILIKNYKAELEWYPTGTPLPVSICIFKNEGK